MNKEDYKDLRKDSGELAASLGLVGLGSRYISKRALKAKKGDFFRGFNKEVAKDLGTYGKYSLAIAAPLAGLSAYSHYKYRKLKKKENEERRNGRKE